MLNESLQTEGCFVGLFDVIRITMLRDRVARGVVIGWRKLFSQVITSSVVSDGYSHSKRGPDSLRHRASSYFRQKTKGEVTLNILNM
jgi:hypothetical protein